VRSGDYFGAGWGISSAAKEDVMFVCGCVIHFMDGGEPEEQVLHQGTLEECKHLMDIIPAVSYSGIRPVKECQFVIVEKERP
jgi:hypothetical protein